MGDEEAARALFMISTQSRGLHPLDLFSAGINVHIFENAHLMVQIYGLRHQSTLSFHIKCVVLYEDENSRTLGVRNKVLLNTVIMYK